MKKRTPRKVQSYPVGLRVRIQRSGVVHYYYEAPRSKHRAEVSLGKDFREALLKRAKLLLNFEHIDSNNRTDFQFISRLYLEACVPTLDTYDQARVRESINRLQIYFCENRLTLCEQTVSQNKTPYLASRGSKAQIRGGREWTLLWVILSWVKELEQLSTIWTVLAFPRPPCAGPPAAHHIGGTPQLIS